MAPETLREALRVHFYIQKENKRGKKHIQAIRGMNDYLPAGETAIWQRIEGTLKNVLGSYGYSEIRLPIVESRPRYSNVRLVKSPTWLKKRCTPLRIAMATA